MHFQRAPQSEAKLVICVVGAVYDVMADVRPGSPTFGLWDADELTPENRRALFLPERRGARLSDALRRQHRALSAQ